MHREDDRGRELFGPGAATTGMSEADFSVTDLELLAGLAMGLTLQEIARRRWVTHSALSRALHALEKRTGLRLVERSGRRIRLTAQGLELARTASQALEGVREVARTASALRRGEAGLLRIVASATPADYLLPEVIGAFVAEVPGVRVSLRVAGLLALDEEIRAGDYDVGVGPSEPVPPGWNAEPLYEDAVAFFVAPGHPYANRSVAWETLRSGVLVGALSGSAWARVWARVARRPFDAEYVVELRNPEAVKQVVSTGCGVGILPRSAVEREIRGGQLAPVRVPGIHGRLPYSLFLRRGGHPPLIERFREVLRRTLIQRQTRSAVTEPPGRQTRSGPAEVRRPPLRR